MSRSLSALVMVLMGTTFAGCSSSKPLALWQSRLEQYVTAQANGDMNVLRQSPAGGDSAQRKFGVLDGASEAQGVLLGFHLALDRHWFVYLVGVTTDRDVKDIHMMAVARNTSANRISYTWIAAGADTVATSRYRTLRLTQWKKNNPQAEGEKGFEITFPAPDDVFTLSTAGNTATATDPRSGATWTLVFTQSNNGARAQAQ